MRRQQAATMLQRESELMDIVQLVGPDALQDMERLVRILDRLEGRDEPVGKKPRKAGKKKDPGSSKKPKKDKKAK